MRRVTARILDGVNVVAENVAVWINEEADRACLQAWYGHFQLEQLPDELLNSQGRSFEIQLSDGRSGRFIVQQISLTTTPISVSILSASPLH